MELYSFNASNVEQNLNDINSVLQILSFSINGLKNDNRITDSELYSFEFILNDAHTKMKSLLAGLKPLWLEKSEKVILLFGVDDSLPNK